MIRPLVSLFALIVLSNACVTAGKIGPQGYTHEKLGYSLAYAQPAEQLFINKSWKLEADQKGQPKTESTYYVKAKSVSGHEESILVNEADLIFKHKETNGVISVQSFPLTEYAADKKLPIVAKDLVERVSGLYFVSLGSSSARAGVGRNLVTNIVESRPGTMGSAETYEIVVDVANAEQLRLNPDHRLQRYKMLLIRPKAVHAWKDKREKHGKFRAREKPMIEETYPALIALTYAMDHGFYADYLPDFDGLVSRLKLRI